MALEGGSALPREGGLEALEGTQTGANGPGSSYRVDTELWESLCSSLRRPVTSKSVPAALVAVHGCGPRRAKPPKKRQNRVLRGRIWAV